MSITINKASLDDIHLLRMSFLQENNFQFVYNKCHQYGWADSWLVEVDGMRAGYAAVWGQNERGERDAIFEFYLIRPYRKMATLIFQQLIEVTGATWIECQSNDFLITSMLYEFASNIIAEAILFEDYIETHLNLPDVVFGRDPKEVNTGADMGGYFLKAQDEVVATGGFMLNYNFPYADIYMEVKELHRKTGMGSLMVQQLKKEIYRIGRVPSARCNIMNQASKATLLKAGFEPCGCMLKGAIRTAH